MCTIVIEALTPLDRISCIKMYKNNARSRLFCRIAKRSIDWQSRFVGLGSNEMTELFTGTIFAILSAKIPNKVMKCNDKDPPWITPELKTAIKRKHRVFKEYKDRGRRLEDWNLVKEVRNETSTLITKAKENSSTMGRKLSDPDQGINAYWAILNRLINKKKTLNIPPLLENGIFVTKLQTKADILNEYFVQQCSTIVNSSTLPNFQPTYNTLLQSLDIDREKVTKLIRALDTTKAHWCDDISISMIKICDTSIVEPLCLIFEKCLERGI